MKLQIRKNLLHFLITLALALAVVVSPNVSYASGSVQAELTSPKAHQVYRPGDTVEITGTAQGLTEVSIVVRNKHAALVYMAQPRVTGGTFTTSFTLAAGAVEGEYTIYLGGLGLAGTQSYKFEVSNTVVAINLEKPAAGAEFEAGDTVEIAGSVQNINTFAICVRNSKDGRIYEAQPAVADGSFATRFTLPADALAGEYTITITGAGLTAAVTSQFTVTSTVTPEDPILSVNGSGVTSPVSYTRAQLEAMNQQRAVLSATSDYPEDLVVAVEGIPLRTLLDNAGINWETAQIVSFAASDGYTANFTIDELFNQKRYIFPDKTEIEPVIALKRAERSSDYNDMSEQDTPVFCYGQRAQTEQTLLWFVKRLETITVKTDTPGQWAAPVTKILTPGSQEKVETQGGEVASGSKIYLESSQAITKIYYTTDGSEPTLDSNIFNLHGCGPLQGQVEPIVVDADVTVKAKAVGRGKQDSEVMTLTFTVAGTGVQGIYTVTPADDPAYTSRKTDDGIDELVVNSGFSGFKYFSVTVSPVEEHPGSEKAVFVQVRDGVQLTLNATGADFDTLHNAMAGFNVLPGDIVRVFIVDDLTNDSDSNPHILE